MVEQDRSHLFEIDNPLYHQIPHLIEQSLRGRPNRAERAKKSLMAMVTEDPFYDSAFIIFEATQRLILGEKSPAAARKSILFLGELLQIATASVIQMEAKYLRATTLTTRAAEKAITNDVNIQQIKYLQTFIQQVIPKGYSAMLQSAHYLKSASTGQSLEIRFRSPGLSDRDKIKQEQELQLLANWHNLLWEVLQADDLPVGPAGAMTSKRDDFVDVFKAEPRLKVFPRERLVNKSIAGLSIEQIEKIPYPPSNQDLDRMTDYLAGVFSSPMARRDRSIIEALFFGPTFFRSEPHGVVRYRNFNILASINLWQERFIQQLIYDRDPHREELARTILQGISERSTGLMLYNALQFTSYPLEHDPQFRGDNAIERYAQHPFLNQAITEFKRANPNVTFFYADEIGRQYFQTVIYPLLRQRLSDFGMSRKLTGMATVIQTELRARPFSEIHLETLSQYFEEQCGQEFLDRLNRHFNDIRSITRSAWQSILERGLHYLPMQQGFNIIEFSEGSMPNILGIESVILNTSGSPQEWEENVTFRLPGTAIAINGKLDQEGRLKLRAPLENRIPGLYTLLNHIAVLVFHDLVIQEKKEKEEQVKKRGSGVNQQPRVDLPQQSRSNGGILPRTQTDTELVADVYKKTRQTPRRVELHKRHLPGNDGYLQAISSYMESKRKYEEVIRSNRREVETERANTELAVAAAELRAAREHAKKASDSKIRSLPARFNLGSVQDPATNEVRYFETWVVEHTSPKPTAEELKSPIKLFEKYYRNSSALASLDQLKPWFVGE